MCNQREFIGIWRKWYAKQTNQQPEKIKINGRHGKAAKEMLLFFREAYPEHDEGYILSSILGNWDKLPEFTQRNFMELWSINDHLNNIINGIKQSTSNNREREINEAKQRLLREGSV